MTLPGRNDPCPCGSGKKFKRCCAGKSFTFVDNSEDSVTLAIPMHPGSRQVISKLEADFVRHFERQPGEGDPMMLGKYLMSDEDIEHATVQAMIAAKTDPAHVYAYKKTGYLIVGDHLIGIPVLRFKSGTRRSLNSMH